MGSGWIALLSGGKDSVFALYDTQQRGHNILHAVTAQPVGDSYLFHTPATEIVSLQAESMGIDHSTFPVDKTPHGADHHSTTAGDAELEPLRNAIAALLESRSESIEGLVVGAVASRFQRDRIERLCEAFDLQLQAPLWHCSPIETLEDMIAVGFDIRIVAVAAGGLDAHWLGKRFDSSLIQQLVERNETAGIHPMGEGGEYETVVLDGPNFVQALAVTATRKWDGTRGRLEIETATLTDEAELTITGNTMSPGS